MGNWHCISNSCAEVHYREYLPPIIRWRYLGEDWNEIEGDDYNLEETRDCSGVPWGFFYKTVASTQPRYVRPCSITVWDREYYRAYFQYSNETPFINLRIVMNREVVASSATVDSSTFLSAYDCYPSQINILVDTPVAKNRLILNTSGYGIEVRNFRPSDGDLHRCTNQCTFTVTKNGEVVHQETRNVCPEVEKLPCRLSDERKVIEIKKLPYLERVEVVPYGYQNFGFGVYQAIIPNECLNIYNNLTTTIIPQFEGFPTPTNAAQATYGHITQICSPPGCPPPEYTVICDCECESCPPNTCAVNCGDHICCYDTTTGKSIEQIEFSDYCGSAV